MLSPDYILRISEGAEEIASQLHDYIINKIVERIVTRLDRGDNYLLTAVDKWQMEVLQDSGYLYSDIAKEISRLTGIQEKEVKKAMEDAGVTALSYDDAVYKAAGLSPTPLQQSPHLIRLMQRNFEATMGYWDNYTRTTANASQRLFISETDRAYNLVTSGAISYTQAVKEAVNRVAENGVIVTYPSGHRDTIETATLRVVRTGISQATGDIQIARMEEMEWDTILVSSHLGARVGDGMPNAGNHAWWQGKFYSRSGNDNRYPPFSVTGYGTGPGLCGWNCRHSFGPGDGVFNPYDKFDSEENRQYYELTQRQRPLERRIRKTKRQVQAAETAKKCADSKELQEFFDKQFTQKAKLLAKQNKAYNQFCEENNMRRLQDRLDIAGWDKNIARRAAGAARRK